MSDFDDEAYLTGDAPAPESRERDRRLEPDRGTMILVFGILGLVVCIIFGILAWVWGNEDLRKMKAGRMTTEGKGSTEAGRILGMISCILTLLGVGIFVVAMVIGGIGSAASSGY